MSSLAIGHNRDVQRICTRTRASPLWNGIRRCTSYCRGDVTASELLDCDVLLGYPKEIEPKLR